MPICKNIRTDNLRKLCSDDYPKGSWIIPITILTACLFNGTTIINLVLNSKLYQTSFLGTVLIGFTLSVVLITFHLYNQTSSISSLIRFDSRESFKCKAIASSLFGLSLSFQFCNVVFFLKIYLKLKHIQSKTGFEDNLFLIMIVVMAGVFSYIVFSSDTTQTSLCILQFTILKQMIVHLLKGFLSITVIGTMIFIHREVTKTRKASHRKEKKSEKVLKVRLFSYASIIAVSFLMDLLHQHCPFCSIYEFYLLTVYSYFLLLPISFPVLFGLSTIQFRKCFVCRIGTNMANNALLAKKNITKLQLTCDHET